MQAETGLAWGPPKLGSGMMEGIHSTEHRQEPRRVPEARYSYYRRCQLFRQNGEQCKAPAEKGAQICHAHATQQAMAFRRDLELRIVLAEAVAEMRRQGRPECELADLFTDFKGIQVTLAVMSRWLIQGRIDCKTAGRLIVHLQTMSKLLWQTHRKKKPTTEARRHGEQQETRGVCADGRRLKPETSPLINTDNTDKALRKQRLSSVRFRSVLISVNQR